MTDVDKYLAKVEQPQKAELERIRKIVKKSVPDAEEVISYGMPGFKYKNKYLVGYAAFKNHMSLFPTSRPVDKLKNKLSGFEVSKGTIQLTVENPIPESLIIELLAVRLTAITKR